MQRLAFTALALMASCPAYADTLDQVLFRARHEAKSIAASVAEMEVEMARAALPLSAWRPKVEARYDAEWKQDSTLPGARMRADPLSKWGVTVDYTLYDFGARRARLDAARRESASGIARLAKRIGEDLAEVAGHYVKAWKSAEFARECTAQIRAARAARDRINQRRPDAASAADERVANGEIAGLAVLCTQARGDEIEARALAAKHIDLPKTLAPPSLPILGTSPADAALDAIEVLEVEERILAAEATLLQKRLERLPVIAFFGTAAQETEKTYSDFEAGIRVKVNLLDSDGYDLQVAEVAARLRAARASREATIAAVKARITTAELTAKAAALTAETARRAVVVERDRMADAAALVDIGKSRPIEIVQAAKRLATAYRAWVDAYAAVAEAQIKHALATSRLARGYGNER